MASPLINNTTGLETQTSDICPPTLRGPDNNTSSNVVVSDWHITNLSLG